MTNEAQDIVAAIRGRVHDAPIATERLLDDAADAIERLRAALTECADDLAAYVAHEHGAPPHTHSVKARCYERDMTPVRAARAQLGDQSP